MAEITLAQLTEGRTDGNGVFDELMKVVAAHLQEQFDKKAIRQADYAEVYLGSLQATLQQAMQFVLTKEKAGKEADLIQAQIDKAARENALLQEQLNKLLAEIALLQAQKLKVEAETANLGKQGLLLDDELLMAAKQREKIDQEILLAQQQIIKMVSETALIDQQKLNAITQNSIYTQQVLKITAETGLIEQKVFTEQAQILDIVNGTTVAGVIGKQKALYAAQTDGFKRDAEQKLAKLMIDTWSVRRTTDDATQANTTNGLDDAAIGAVLTKAKLGIGVA